MSTKQAENLSIINVAVFGSKGRMGQYVIELLAEHPQMNYILGVHSQSNLQDQTVLKELSRCHAIIDFSIANAQRSLIDLLIAVRAYKNKNQIDSVPLALVSGVTGQHEKDIQAIDEYAGYAPVFHAPNFSLGVALMKKFVQEASTFLGEDFDIEIFELHHRQKQDAPSGTALYLADAARKGRPHEQAEIHTSHQTMKESHHIHVNAGRGGQVIGDHFVYFLGKNERLELVHRARDRALFAQGALKATQWLYGRVAGRYTMDDLWS